MVHNCQSLTWFLENKNNKEHYYCLLDRMPVHFSGEGQGGGRLGEKGTGGVREVGEEGEGSRIPKVVGSGRKREKLCNIAQYLPIEKNAKWREPTNTGRELG